MWICFHTLEWDDWIVCFLPLSFKSSLNILDTNPLSNILFINIFSQFIACYVIIFKMYFEGKRFFYLDEIQLSFFSRMAHTICYHILDILCLMPGYKDFLMFPSMTFIVLCFRFQTNDSFWINFCNERGVRTRGIFCIWMSSCPNIICWKHPFFTELLSVPFSVFIFFKSFWGFWLFLIWLVFSSCVFLCPLAFNHQYHI